MLGSLLDYFLLLWYRIKFTFFFSLIQTVFGSGSVNICSTCSVVLIHIVFACCIQGKFLIQVIFFPILYLVTVNFPAKEI